MYLPLRRHFSLLRRTESFSRGRLILSHGGFGSTEAGLHPGILNGFSARSSERWCGKLRGKTELIYLPTAVDTNSDGRQFLGAASSDWL
jgi:hypothetical protein